MTTCFFSAALAVTNVHIYSSIPATTLQKNHDLISLSGIKLSSAAREGERISGCLCVTVSVSQVIDNLSLLFSLQTLTSARTLTPVAKFALTTRGILNVNAMKVMRWTLLLRPARQKVSRVAGFLEKKHFS